jgi:hypothetical protein
MGNRYAEAYRRNDLKNRCDCSGCNASEHRSSLVKELSLKVELLSIRRKQQSKTKSN